MGGSGGRAPRDGWLLACPHPKPPWETTALAPPPGPTSLTLGGENEGKPPFLRLDSKEGSPTPDC